jgi:rod shape-determining protein MreC
MKSTGSKIFQMAKSGAVAALIPVFFLYILLDKPDYKIMNSLSGIVVPAARTLGDGITWPVRIVGKISEAIGRHASATAENKRLRAQIEEMARSQTACDIYAAENQRLARIADIRESYPWKTIAATLSMENASIIHSAFMLDKGLHDGIRPGMAVLTTTGYLAGIISDVYEYRSKVMSLSDSKSNIPVRIIGGDIYGFMRGTGAGAPVLEYFSDQSFVPSKGLRLVTSSIGGSLPDNIPVGEISRIKDKIAQISVGAKSHGTQTMLVLEFDKQDGYK